MPTERGLVARLRDEVQNDCEDCACVGEKKQFHCHRHKALLADADAYLAATAEEPSGVVPWRCFHCDDMFTDEHAARLHFGPDEGSQPACKIKAGAEGGLLGALRRAEADAGAAWKAIHEETTDAARAHYAQQDRHATQLRLVEEAGYERGLADGMALRESPAPPAEASAVELPKVQQCLDVFLSGMLERHADSALAQRDAQVVINKELLAERASLAERLALAEAQRDAARALVARDLPELSRCTQIGGFAAIMGVEFDEYQSVKMQLRDVTAERDRLARAIRARHDHLCTADYTARGRHHPDCQLYELGTDAERAEARAFPEYAAGHPFCDDHPDDMPPAPQRCWQCEVVRLEAALADAQAETRRACAEELCASLASVPVGLTQHAIPATANMQLRWLADRWAPAAPSGKEE